MKAAGIIMGYVLCAAVYRSMGLSWKMVALGMVCGTLMLRWMR